MRIDLPRLSILVALWTACSLHVDCKPSLPDFLKKKPSILSHGPTMRGPSFLQQPPKRTPSVLGVVEDGYPCTHRALPSIPLELPTSLCSFISNRDLEDPCILQLKITIPDTCKDPEMLRGAPVVFFFSGFGVRTADYATLVHTFAHWGYVVVQYEREVPNAAPPNDVETQYTGHLMKWLDNQLSNSSELLYGRLSNNITVVGHSMGGALASFAAGSFPDRVHTAVLMDPVDFSFLDDRVCQAYLSKFAKPVLIFNVGVRCIDRTGCAPSTSTAAETAGRPVPPCAPSWWCCDWDSKGAAPLTSMGLGSGLNTVHGGVNKFIAVAAQGSWVADITSAGHMSFTDWDPETEPDMAVQCPAGKPNVQLLPIVSDVMLTWTQHVIRGLPIDEFLDWATSPAQSGKSLKMSFL